MHATELLYRYLLFPHFVQTEALEQVVQSVILALHKIHFKFPVVESVQTLAATKIKI